MELSTVGALDQKQLQLINLSHLFLPTRKCLGNMYLIIKHTCCAAVQHPTVQ